MPEVRPPCKPASSAAPERGIRAGRTGALRPTGVARSVASLFAAWAVFQFGEHLGLLDTDWGSGVFLFPRTARDAWNDTFESRAGPDRQQPTKRCVILMENHDWVGHSQ
jgi:hypothetical protein